MKKSEEDEMARLIGREMIEKCEVINIQGNWNVGTERVILQSTRYNEWHGGSRVDTLVEFYVWLT